MSATGNSIGNGVGRVADVVWALLDTDQVSRMLDIKVLSADEGRARARMQVRPDMVNGHRILHGGLVFTLADTVFACAANSFGPAAVTAAADVQFLRPAYLGDVLIAEAAIRSRSGRTIICDVTIRRGDEVVAEFRARGSLLGERSSAQ
ncbi:hydroxyphenylacetyl-CoA thioesterase PaaI [Nocardia sp. NPDC050630]|uniref:hydroxyphenylacetyl-CoA thioesterase PaaI n=1 Tax=Nocardia sp. NPDC050630 TaxID=3364321 RepID=UPI00378BE4A0